MVDVGVRTVGALESGEAMGDAEGRAVDVVERGETAAGMHAMGSADCCCCCCGC